MRGKMATRKDLKYVLVKNELHQKLMQIKYNDSKFKNLSDVIEWLIQQAKL